jgi:hypothetical protein
MGTLPSAHLVARDVHVVHECDGLTIGDGTDGRADRIVIFKEEKENIARAGFEPASQDSESHMLSLGRNKRLAWAATPPGLECTLDMTENDSRYL